MYDPQHLVDLQDNATAPTNSWLAGGQDHHHHSSSSSSPILGRTESSYSNTSNTNTNTSTTAANLDRNLFNDLVEIVPLVQSLIVILLKLFSLYLSSIY